MSNTINGRTPEEIKKGLECCNTFNACSSCPYEHIVDTEHGWGCVVIRNADTLAYIQQLERKRDAAVEDMTELMKMAQSCRYCKHLTEDGDCTFDSAAHIWQPWCWQWRGVQNDG